jgi:hypothetical protein
MSRERSTPVAQATWRSGGLHVWGWDGEAPASSAWLYGGFGRNRWSGAVNDWHDSPVSYGEVQRLDLQLPGRRLLVPAVRLDGYGAAVWLSELPAREHTSPTIGWFAAVLRVAVGLVAAGRVTPVLVEEAGATAARWRPVLDDPASVGPGAGVLEHLAGLEACAPPIARVGSDATVVEIVEAVVDDLVRSMLQRSGWRPELGRSRAPDVQALRAVFIALARRDALVRAGTDEFDREVVLLGAALERHRRRLAGEPVVRPRVRLVVPVDALDPWEVVLELVDDADTSRWCTADDVWSRGPRAVDLAGGSERLAALEREVVDLVDRVAATVPGLAGLAVAHQPTDVELDLEEAGDFLDVAPAELERLGVELVGPEHLVRAKVAVRGRATPAPADDRRARFGAEAIVEWAPVVDGVELSDAELARVEEAGAALVHVGHRWVRIDPAGVRRTRALLDDRRATSSRVGVVGLLQLAASSETPVDAPDDLSATTTVDGAFDTADERSVEEFDLTRWVSLVLDGVADERLDEVVEPPGFVGELRHYQRRGYGWLRFLARLGTGGVLADDMGLGKTATTLAHLATRPGPHLVVCPLSVVHNWESETARFTPGLRVTVHHGADRHRGGAALFGPADADVVVTTYGVLSRDPALAEVEWSTVVLDEAQTVKNPNTKAHRAARALSAGQKLALTGTPVENRLADLWSLLDLTVPGLLGGQQHFRLRYGTPIERHGDADAADALRRLTQPFVLRRTKADKRLLPDLPDKIEQIAFATLTREQAVLYQRVVDELLVDADTATGMQRRGLVLASLTRLKQICNHPAHALGDGSRLAGRSGKLARFDELVADLLDVGEQALVFTQFAEMGVLLQRHLAEHQHLSVPFLHGGVPRHARDAMVTAFQEGSGAPLLLVSLRAGGTGLNLTAASQVIHYDRWWNPAVEDQATDRAWRIGQRRTVNVHKLVCEGTVEERIGVVIDEKRRLADVAVGTGETWLSELSTDELRDLVVLEHR